MYLQPPKSQKACAVQLSFPPNRDDMLPVVTFSTKPIFSCSVIVKKHNLKEAVLDLMTAQDGLDLFVCAPDERTLPEQHQTSEYSGSWWEVGSHSASVFWDHSAPVTHQTKCDSWLLPLNLWRLLQSLSYL